MRSRRIASSSTQAEAWTHRVALTATAATAVLIVAGGLVTNTGSALAVPDWPTTFGHNMFLYPWSQMVGGVLYEHGHRLLGVLVGFLTLALALILWMGGARGSLRGLGIVALVLVCVQGLLGGLRVILLRDVLAIFHGALAQLVFALLTALCVLTSSGWRAAQRPLPVGQAERLSRFALAVTAIVYGQIILGTLTTHAGWVLPHLGGAIVVLVTAMGLTAQTLAHHSGRPALVWPARALVGLLVLQAALGVGAYAMRFTDFQRPEGAAGSLAFPVAHRVTASLLLGAAVVLVLHSWRLRGLVGTSRGEVGVPPIHVARDRAAV